MRTRTQFPPVAMMVAAMVLATAVAWASNPDVAFQAATGGQGAFGQRAALEVSVVVAPTCTVRTAVDTSTPVAFACSRGALPGGMAPRVQITSGTVPAIAVPSASVTNQADSSLPARQNPILSIQF